MDHICVNVPLVLPVPTVNLVSTSVNLNLVSMVELASTLKRVLSVVVCQDFQEHFAKLNQGAINAQSTPIASPGDVFVNRELQVSYVNEKRRPTFTNITLSENFPHH